MSDDGEVSAVRVMVVDDQPPVLAVMAALVGETPGFEVVGGAASGEEAVTMGGGNWLKSTAMKVSTDGVHTSLLAGLSQQRCEGGLLTAADVAGIRSIRGRRAGGLVRESRPRGPRGKCGACRSFR